MINSSKKGAIGILVAVVVLLSLTADSETASRKFFGLWSTRWMLLAVAGLIVAAGLWIRGMSRQAYLGYVACNSMIVVCWIGFELLGFAGVVSYAKLFNPGDQSGLGTRAQPNVDLRGVTKQDTATMWGLDSEPIEFHYVTNAIGFRNPPDRNEADVYLLGDSIIVSALLPYEETLSARLEKQLERPLMNVALIGISPQREHALFREAKLPLEGKLVLQLIFEGNDLRDSFGERQSVREEQPNQTLLHHTILLLQRLTQPVVGIARKRTCTIGDQPYTFFWTRESFAGFESEVEVIEKDLEAFAAEIQRAGGRYGVVYVPAKLRVLAPVCAFPADSDLRDVEAHLNPMRDHLRAWSERSGIAMLDVTDALIASAKDGRIPWFWGDTHPNAIGHQVMADQIAAWDFVRAP